MGPIDSRERSEDDIRLEEVRRENVTIIWIQLGTPLGRSAAVRFTLPATLVGIDPRRWIIVRPPDLRSEEEMRDQETINSLYRDRQCHRQKDQLRLKTDKIQSDRPMTRHINQPRESHARYNQKNKRTSSNYNVHKPKAIKSRRG